MAGSTTQAKSTFTADERFIYQLGGKREAVGTARWLFPFEAGDLLLCLGLGSPWWWCGLCLPRKTLFGPEFEGDVDILAGPLEMDSMDGEPISEIANFAGLGLTGGDRRVTPYERVLDAIRCGRVSVRWPPALTNVVACEVKVSWFDAQTGKLKCTHAGEGRRIKGNLKALLRRGINRVSFLHLTATKPTRHGQFGRAQSMFDAQNATERVRHRGNIYDPREIPGCGYITATIGADPERIETRSAATIGPRVMQAPSENVANGHCKRQWEATLRKMLADCDRPCTPSTYILPCSACGRWGTTVTPVGARCQCGAELLPPA